MSAALHAVREGVVNVLPVSLRVRPIAPEHLHRLQHAAVAVAQEIPLHLLVLPRLQRLLEAARPVIRQAHHAALDAHRRALRVDHGVQPLQRSGGEHDVVVDVVDVVRGQQQRHQEAEEERRVPVGHPHVLRDRPGLQQRLVVLVLHALQHDDLIGPLGAVHRRLQLPLQPGALELRQHNADGFVAGIVGIAGEIPHVVHALALV